MKTAVIYSSRTGNTEKVAAAIKEKAEKQELVYFGHPEDNIPQADIYFIGSWTDKGDGSSETISFIEGLKNKKVAFFGTAGFGGSEEYYRRLAQRIKNHLDESVEVVDCFYCQGRMPVQVRERYVKMLTENPDDADLKISIKNFDEALSHPDKADLENAGSWAESVLSCI